MLTTLAILGGYAVTTAILLHDEWVQRRERHEFETAYERKNRQIEA